MHEGTHARHATHAHARARARIPTLEMNVYQRRLLSLEPGMQRARPGMSSRAWGTCTTRPTERLLIGARKQPT
eukprot:11962593-Alexandrium_andersonii.AAC.1